MSLVDHDLGTLTQDGGVRSSSVCPSLVLVDGGWATANSGPRELEEGRIFQPSPSTESRGGPPAHPDRPPDALAASWGASAVVPPFSGEILFG